MAATKHSAGTPKEYSVMHALTRRRFAPRWHWTLLAAAGMVGFVQLGQWQLRRAEEKQALLQSFSAGAESIVVLPIAGELPRYQRVRVNGRYDPTRQFLLENVSHDGRPGVRVLTPLRRASGLTVLVDRGFIATSGDRSEAPPVAIDTDPRELVARVAALPRPALELTPEQGAGWPRRVSFPTMDELAVALGEGLHPQLLLLESGQPDGFLREWRPDGLAPERHLGYAVQWFGLAATVFITWLVLSLKPRRSTPT